MNNRKGVSALVAAVITILITVVGVIIAWGLVIPMVIEGRALDDQGLDLEIVKKSGYTFCDVSTNILYIQVRREADDSGVKNIIFKVTIEGDTVSYSNDGNKKPWAVPNRNEAEIYKLNVADYINGNCNLINDISVVPVLLDGSEGSINTFIEGGVNNGESSGDDSNVGNSDEGYMCGVSYLNLCGVDECASFGGIWGGGECKVVSCDVFCCSGLGGEFVDYQCLGNELVNDGDFEDGGAGWSAGSIGGSWDFSDADAEYSSFTTSASDILWQDLDLEDGKGYNLKYKLFTSFGSYDGITPSVGGVSLTKRAATGIYTETFTATNGGKLIFYIDGGSDTFGVRIDGVSVREILE